MRPDRLSGFFPRLRHGDSQPFSEMPKGFVLKQGLVSKRLVIRVQMELTTFFALDYFLRGRTQFWNSNIFKTNVEFYSRQSLKKRKEEKKPIVHQD